MECDLSALPKPVVELVGCDANAFSILGRVQPALRRAGWTDEQIDQFQSEATSGDYHHLVGTCLKYTRREDA
jgi:hypothetical protein